MHTLLAPLWVLVLAAAPAVDTKFVQVAPAEHEQPAMVRSENEESAVLLIQGLCIHPFSETRVRRACWQGWQEADSDLVKALGKDSDVFAFSYSQNVSVDDVADSAELAEHVGKLKALGYTKIILVGHSAGGVIARQFVEDRPDAGVTKVIQVCSPNGGSCWGMAARGVRKSQEVFVRSLCKQQRADCLTARRGKAIPENVEFVCLVGQQELDINMEVSFELGEGNTIALSAQQKFRGDGIVASDSQWPADLQEQRIPAVCMPIYHFQAMRDDKAIEKITQLAREKQSRLSTVDLEKCRREVLGAE